MPDKKLEEAKKLLMDAGYLVIPWNDKTKAEFEAMFRALKDRDEYLSKK